MPRSSAVTRNGSGLAPGFSGAQNTPATVVPRAMNASSTLLPKACCPMMARRMGSLVCAGERPTLPVMRLGLQILDQLRNQEVQRTRGLLGPNGSTAGPPEGLLRVCAHRPSALAILSAAKRPVVTGGNGSRPEVRANPSAGGPGADLRCTALAFSIAVIHQPCYEGVCIAAFIRSGTATGARDVGG